jgi:TolA-binding protein
MNISRTRIAALFAGVFALSLPSIAFPVPVASPETVQPAPEHDEIDRIRELETVIKRQGNLIEHLDRLIERDKDSRKRLNEAQERLKQLRNLEEEQKRLREQVREAQDRAEVSEGEQKRLLEQLEAQTTPPPPVELAPSPPPQPDPIVQNAASRPAATLNWMLIGTTAFSLSLCIILLLRIRRTELAPDMHEADTITAAPEVETAPPESESPDPVTRPPSHPFLPTLPILPDWDPASPALDVQAMKVLTPVEHVRNHDSTIELAEIMLSFGRVNSAAEALTGFIENNPKEAFTPWLKLLEVYRASGQHIEFDKIAQKLNKTFNVWMVNWDNFNDARHPAHCLEAMPHIMARLQQLWGTRECQAYLQYLLRDTRDETRRGFPLAAISDILCLNDILEYTLGPYTGPISLDDSSLDNAPLTETEGEGLSMLEQDPDLLLATTLSPATNEDSPAEQI